MSARGTPADEAGLQSAPNMEIGSLPNDLKCAMCRFVLKDACQVPCGCRFCRVCIDGATAGGAQFCPGGSRECAETPLSAYQPDDAANKSISRLTPMCAQEACSRESSLVDMEGHLQVCPTKPAPEPVCNPGDTRGRTDSEILIEMLKSELALRDAQMKLVMDSIGSITRDIQSMRRDVDIMRSQLQSIRGRAAPDEESSGRDQWKIYANIEKTEWNWKTSDIFTMETRPYRYQLASSNRVVNGALLIFMTILAGPNDARLSWPFSGAVTVMVADRHKRHACSHVTKQCVIEKPPDNRYKSSDVFLFSHFQLKARGLDLDRGVRVSCQIVPGVPDHECAGGFRINNLSHFH